MPADISVHHHLHHYQPRKVSHGRTFCSQLNFPKSLPPIAGGGREVGGEFMSCAVCGSACESLKFDTHKIPSGI